MAEWRASTYGDRFADVYDEWYSDDPDVEATVEVLAELAGGGSVLELGVGTGRLALPLAARGLDVHGVDVSPAMLALLRDKPGGDRIAATLGDFADVPVAGEYRLVFCARNTFFNLDTAARQVDCFAAVAPRLADRGVFVVEAFVPDPTLLTRGPAVGLRTVGADEVTLTATRVDTSAQTMETAMISCAPTGPRIFPTRLRYTSPAELDLMARIAGLELVYRWADWQRTPFTSDSSSHISVYAA